MKSNDLSTVNVSVERNTIILSERTHLKFLSTKKLPCFNRNDPRSYTLSKPKCLKTINEMKKNDVKFIVNQKILFFVLSFYKLNYPYNYANGFINKVPY